MNKLQSIGNIIKEKRLSLNLRMDEVADKTGISRATLWMIEGGSGNCSISSLLRVLDVLDLSISICGASKSNRDRASRSNTALDKKINRFVIMCVEQYALISNESSAITYKKMKESGVIKLLVEDYEDLHGMSTVYLNQLIGKMLEVQS